MNTEVDFTCPCGANHNDGTPAFYAVAHLITLGARIEVTTASGTWRVPRMWIAFHGLKAWELTHSRRNTNGRRRTMITYPEVEGPCAECGNDLICTPMNGKNLCNDCWHAARHKLQPWQVQRVDSEETRRSIRETVPGYTVLVVGSAMLEEEAKEFAEEMERRWNGTQQYEAVPSERWWGHRIAHPGYMQKRRAELRSAGA